MIAIPTHGRTGQARLLLGSVAGELLKAHVAPIFMVAQKAYLRNPSNEGFLAVSLLAYCLN